MLTILCVFLLLFISIFISFDRFTMLVFLLIMITIFKEKIS
ncbi:hypothetical protein [Campylobacter canadensis]|nr:hypothetical protein [Campylobacter canadensis]